MRALRHRTVICGCLIAALCATACLNDDEKSGSRSQLSAEQKAIAIASTAGNYDGHVFFKNSDTNREDSVKTTWTVSGVDSTCTIGRLNVALFANYMPAGQDRDIVASEADSRSRWPCMPSTWRTTTMNLPWCPGPS